MAVIDTITGRFRTQGQEEIDYVKDGTLYIGASTSNILVGSESDLALLEGYTPGSYAHTAGWQNIWELDVDGETWVPVLSGGDPA